LNVFKWGRRVPVLEHKTREPHRPPRFFSPALRRLERALYSPSALDALRLKPHDHVLREIALSLPAEIDAWDPEPLYLSGGADSAGVLQAGESGILRPSVHDDEPAAMRAPQNRRQTLASRRCNATERR